MKHALLALAAVLVWLVYEADRDARLWADVEAGRDAALVLRHFHTEDRRVWIVPEPPPGSRTLDRAPRGAEGSAHATGRIEREQSIRLFGPGVSRRHQIHV